MRPQTSDDLLRRSAELRAIARKYESPALEAAEIKELSELHKLASRLFRLATRYHRRSLEYRARALRAEKALQRPVPPDQIDGSKRQFELRERLRSVIGDVFPNEVTDAVKSGNKS